MTASAGGDAMPCDHDIVEVTTAGDTFHRGLCIKCNTRFDGPPTVACKLLEGGPWEAQMQLPLIPPSAPPAQSQMFDGGDV